MRIRVLLLVVFAFVPSAVHAQWSINGDPVCVAANTQQSVFAASDGAHGAILVWEDSRSVQTQISAQRLNAAGVPLWTLDGIQVSPMATRGKVVSDGAGGAIVVWRDSRAGAPGIYAQRLDNLGAKQWVAGGIQVASAFAEPEIDSDGAGGVLITWLQGNQPARDVYGQRLSGAGAALWQAGGIPVCRHPADADEPAVAGLGGGAAAFAWIDFRGGAQRIFARKVGAAGDTLWTALGVGLTPGGPAAFEPSVCSDGAGGAYFAVGDQRLAGQGTHLFIHRLDTNGAAPTGWTLAGVDCGGTLTDPDPKIVRDSNGGALAVQEGGIVSHVTAGGAQDWNVPVSGFDAPVKPWIVAEGAGSAIVGWHDLRNTVNYDVYAAQVLGNGTLSSSCVAGGELLTNGSGSQTTVRGVSDGLGGAIFAWQDARSDGGNIFANHTTCPALVSVPGPIVAGPSLRVAPNPSFGARRALVSLVSGEPAELTLHDLAGRIVARPAVTRGAGGNVIVDLDAEGKLAPGTYFLKLRQGNQVVSVKTTWLR
jgi:hypothetical protein